MGRSKRTLLTFNKNIAPLERSTANHIAAALKMMIVETDHYLVEDDQKIASRETMEKQQQENQEYMNDILAEWFNTTPGEVESVSTISTMSGLDSVATTLSFSIEASSIQEKVLHQFQLKLMLTSGKQEALKA